MYVFIGYRNLLRYQYQQWDQANSFSLLGLGISSYVDRAPGYSITSQQIRALLEPEETALVDAGIKHTFFEVNPDDPNLVPELKEKLASQHWDGVIIGWGVRGQQDLTGVFETAVNLSILETNGGARFMFPTYPDKVLESIRRVFPDFK